MKFRNSFIFIIMLVFTIPASSETAIELPKPLIIKSSFSDVINSRKTTRRFNQEKSVSLEELSTLLFTMQGKTHGNKRAVPSARSVYPLNIYIITNNVKGLDNGLYKMSIDNFRLIKIKSADLKNEITEACSGQSVVENSQVKIIITVTWKSLVDNMGESSRKWGIFEAGLASQNSYLAAAAMNLNTVPVGGMDSDKVAKVIGVNHDKETPIIVNCYGR
jgi:SagB-type dehydrogenase family enzyme